MLALIAGNEGEKRTNIENADVYRKCCAMSLEMTVVTDDKLDEEEWGRILSLSETDFIDGLDKLVVSAARLCGLRANVSDGTEPNIETDPDITDHVAEVDEKVGNSPTK